MRAFILCAVNDIGPVDEVLQRLGVEVVLLAGYIGDEARTGYVVRVVELAAVDCGPWPVRSRLPGDKVAVIVLREERTLMVIEPPGNTRGCRILEVDDRILAIHEGGLVKKRAGTVHEADVREVLRGADALAMKPREDRRRARAIKAMIVIEHTALQVNDPPA